MEELAKSLMSKHATGFSIQDAPTKAFVQSSKFGKCVFSVSFLFIKHILIYGNLRFDFFACEDWTGLSLTSGENFTAIVLEIYFKNWSLIQ